MLVVLSVSDFLNQSKINLAFPVGFTVVWETDRLLLTVVKIILKFF